MKDAIGNELKVGDTIVFMVGSRSPWLSSGVITALTDRWVMMGASKKAPHRCARIKEATEYEL